MARVPPQISYVHEDDLGDHVTINSHSDGHTPLYLYYSPDDETFFVSDRPFTLEDIKQQFPLEEYCFVINEPPGYGVN